MFAIINLIIDGFGVAAIPKVIVRRELGQGLLHQIRVSKHFPPLPIIGSYQSSTHQDVILQVVEQAQKCALTYCASVDPSTAWLV
jgi:DNA-binding transcriptional LysR family regulator